jgi:hypothetical protein
MLSGHGVGFEGVDYSSRKDASSSDLVYESGREAFGAGVPLEQNPYAGTGRSAAYVQWAAGWLAQSTSAR